MVYISNREKKDVYNSNKLVWSQNIGIMRKIYEVCFNMHNEKDDFKKIEYINSN